MREQLRKIVQGGRWTRIERVIEDEAYRSFLAIYDQVCEAILAQVPPERRDSCRAAFTDPDAGYLFYAWIRSHKSQAVVETGAFIGLSALICARALEENEREHGRRGAVYSISLNSFYRVDRPLDIATRTARQLGLSDYVHFRGLQHAVEQHVESGRRSASARGLPPRAADPGTARVVAAPAGRDPWPGRAGLSGRVALCPAR